MAKFNDGDRIVEKNDKSRKGTVERFYFNPGSYCDEYEVRWDSTPKWTNTYRVGFEDNWEHELPSSSSTDAEDALYYMSPWAEVGSSWYDKMKVNPHEEAKPSCSHIRKTYYGLTEAYDYCDKCGVKL